MQYQDYDLAQNTSIDVVEDAGSVAFNGATAAIRHFSATTCIASAKIDSGWLIHGCKLNVLHITVVHLLTMDGGLNGQCFIVED